jgi:hypothetical protein
MPIITALRAPRRRRARAAQVRGEAQAQRQQHQQAPVLVEPALPQRRPVDDQQQRHHHRHQHRFRDERAGQGVHGQEQEQEQRQAAHRRQQHHPQAAVQAGPRDHPRQGQHPEDEDHRVLGEGLGDLVGAHDPERVEHGRHEDRRDPDRDRAGGPEHRGGQQQRHHQHGLAGDGGVRGRAPAGALLPVRGRPVLADVARGDGLPGGHLAVLGVAGGRIPGRRDGARGGLGGAEQRDQARRRRQDVGGGEQDHPQDDHDGPVVVAAPEARPRRRQGGQGHVVARHGPQLLVAGLGQGVDDEPDVGGLFEVAVGAAAAHVHGRGDGARSRQHEHRQLGAELLDLAEDLAPVQAGRRELDHDDVELAVGADQPDGFLPVAGLDHLVGGGAQASAERGAVDRVVVDQQHLDPRRHARPPVRIVRDMIRTPLRRGNCFPALPANEGAGSAGEPAPDATRGGDVYL